MRRALFFLGMTGVIAGVVRCNAILGIERASLDAASESSVQDAIVVDVKMDAGVSCPHGPFGVEKIYFGDPEPELAFDVDADAGLPMEDNETGPGRLSPDGLHFIRSRGGISNPNVCGGCFRVVEHIRLGWDDAWDGPNASQVLFSQSFWPGVRMFLDNLGLIGCHGAQLKCVYYKRTSATDAWPYGWPPDTDHYKFFAFAPFDGGAADFNFTPTPDGRTLVFASNRSSDLVDDPPDADANMDLWTAETNDVDASIVDPRRGYGKLRLHATASSPTDHDTAEWISDDARTIVFTSRRQGDSTLELYLATRASRADSFGAPTKLDMLSTSTTDDDSFSLPSIAALAQHGNRGVGYFRRTNALKQKHFHRFRVCVGSPSP